MEKTERETIDATILEAAPAAHDAYPMPETEPDDAPRPVASMTAADALERLARGDELRDVRIERLVFRGEFSRPVRMRRVHLVQPSFERAEFADEVVLASCTLDRPRFGRPCTFAKGFDLTGSTLVKAMLRNLTVRGTLRCDNLRTRGRFSINGARFEGLVRFWEAGFEGWVNIEDTAFLQQADFRSLSADEGFVLKNCRFAGDFLLRGASVSKKFDANGSRFEALLDLSKAKLHDFAYLEGIAQGERQRFGFQNALAERLLVRTDQLEGRLASEQEGDHARAMHEYALLKRAFGDLHRYEQEDWAFYRFKVNQRRCCARSWRRPWTKLAQLGDWLFLDRGCRYGTSPMRAVVAAAALIVAFALVYAVGIDWMHVEHTPFDGPPTTFANRLLIGLQTSVAAFTSGFGDLRDASRGWMGLPLLVESLVGTLLWGLFIVAFSRKVIR